MLLVTPILFDLLARFTRPRSAMERMLASELGAPARPTSQTSAQPAAQPAE
jgi:multidrug efflux pump